MGAVIEKITLHLPRLPAAFAGLTILHLSDLHLGRWHRGLESWRESLAVLRPDLLVVTGDLGHRSWLWRRSYASFLRLTQGLEPPLGRWVILGNHDSLRLGPALQRVGYRWLFNESWTLERGGDRLVLMGLGQHRRIDTDFPQTLSGVAPGSFKVLLMHYPDFLAQASAAGIDLCLAGHTHGGQICWPDGHPIVGHDALPASMCRGVHCREGTWMVVNRGMGKAGLRVRLFCPPHGLLLELQPLQPTGGSG